MPIMLRRMGFLLLLGSGRMRCLERPIRLRSGILRRFTQALRCYLMPSTISQRPKTNHSKMTSLTSRPTIWGTFLWSHRNCIILMTKKRTFAKVWWRRRSSTRITRVCCPLFPQSLTKVTSTMLLGPLSIHKRRRRYDRFKRGITR